MTLYELDGEYLRLYDMATEMDDEQAFKDTLACLDSELELKGNGYIRVIKSLEMEAKQCDAEIERLKRKKEIRENAVKRLKQALITALDIAGKKDITCGEYTLKIRNNGGLQPLKIEGDVPANFMKIKYEPDNELIRKTLAEGKKLSFAHLEERGRYLKID